MLFGISFCKKTVLFLVAGFMLSLSACNDNQNSLQITETGSPTTASATSLIFNFGFDLRSTPQEDARQYLPFLNYLEKETGYQFKLTFTPKGKNIIDQLGTRKNDFAAIGATSYIKASQLYPVVPLVRGKNGSNKAEYRSFFVVAPKSEIKELKDLPGKRLAFGDQSSTQGHLIPRIVLLQNKISLQQLGNYNYYGSHINCANAVVSKEADVCAMQDTMASEMAAKGLVKIIYRSDYFPSSGIAAHAEVPEEVRLRVTQALLDFQPLANDKNGLYNWHKTEMPNGFIAADEDDYQSLRRWMIQLGLLN